MSGIEIYERPGPTYPQSEDLEPRPVWRFRVRAGNGEIVAQSEGYTTKASAEKGVRALRRALLPGTRQTDREQAAESWQRGFLFAYYQERGWTIDQAEKKSQATPQPWLQEWSDTRNPYRTATPAGDA